MPDLADEVSNEGSATSVHVRNIDSFPLPSKVEVDVGLTAQLGLGQVNRQATNYHTDQESLHSKFVPIFHIEESKSSSESDSSYSTMAMSSSFPAHLPNQAFIKASLGPQCPTADFFAKSVHRPVTSTAAAMLVNLNMLGASWNLPQLYQQQQQLQQQQQQQILYNQQQLQLSHAISNLLRGQQQSVPSPLAPCALPAFNALGAAAGRF